MYTKFLLLFSILCVFSVSVSAQTVGNQDGEAYYLAGKEQFSQGDYAKALTSLKQALPLLTNYDYLIGARKLLAVINVAFSQHKEAVDEFKELLKLAPETILDPLTESPRVIEAFEEARKILIDQGVLSPNISAPSPAEPVQVAPPKAEEQVKPAVVEMAPFAPVLTPAAKIIREEKPKAVETATPAVTINPAITPKTDQLTPLPSPDVKKKGYLQKAQDFYKQKKYLPAAEQLEKALYEDPAYLEAHLLLAKVYKRIEGKHLMAVDELKKVFAQNADHIEAHMLLADIYINRTLEYEKGMEELKIVFSRNPQHAPAHNLMGMFYYKTRQFEKAAGEHQTALAVKPNLFSAYNYLGDAYLQMQRWADAILEYEAALSFLPQNLSLLTDLAIAYEKAGHLKAAAYTWDTLLGNKPSPNQAEYARQRIEKLNETAEDE
ncbi:MAG: tetratricopeptide repeat protein [Candidatus Schekmanbacteria bacterium]|nr:tetratricopeptide repeat protein [Candidatus Schekmanbacteria bacterium]